MDMFCPLSLERMTLSYIKKMPKGLTILEAFLSVFLKKSCFLINTLFENTKMHQTLNALKRLLAF